MIGRGLEDGAEVEGGNAQVLQVVEVLDDADQVAPFEAMLGRRAVPRLQVGRLGYPLASGEPVGKDLVEDGIADPFGRID